MRSIDKIYLDGAFRTPHGTETFTLMNPSTATPIGSVTLADEEDAKAAIAAAKRAFTTHSRTGKAERIEMLEALGAAVSRRVGDIKEAMMEEYGAPQLFAGWSAQHAADCFANTVRTLKDYEFTRRINTTDVLMTPLGVVALITPWNANAGFICSKLATALAAGCTAVLKPSEMSAIQTQVVTDALHEAGLPAGLFNIVTGRGDVVGSVLTSHPDIAKVSFTGSTAVGKGIVRASADTLKRVTLELGGKSPTLILDDADLAAAIPMALQAGFMNSGQACIAGTRILVPESRLEEAKAIARKAANAMTVGSPADPESRVGPMVSQKQWDRVQGYIRLGLEEGAELVAGGEGKPEGLDGYFVKPTVFANVTNDQRIAREEIFGPVVCLIGYRDEEDAIAIANDSLYGLQSYILSGDLVRARRIAARLETGRVIINGAPHEPLAPFGGFKQSGIGREFGTFGLEAYLEPKSVLAPAA
ncbi:aldehyde dehydrogenase family protein [Radicibacter daui]|uniref:aldehyde dehydrogenase family protein n=1 Tax=Radicibacter daui TaxID=3064829 RepID=UPI004046E67F